MTTAKEAAGKAKFHRIKECPFCGTLRIRVHFKNNPFDLDHVYGGYKVECLECGVSTKIWDTQEQAINDWNRRTKEGWAYKRVMESKGIRT